MKRFALAALMAAFALQPLAAAAQGEAPVPNASGQEYLQFVGGSGVNGSFGVQVGPYTGRFASQAPTDPGFNLYCVDFDHFANSTAVNASALGGDLSTTRLGGGLGSLTAYTEAAYLASLFESYAGSTAAWSAIHAAVWTSIRNALPPGDPNSGVPVPDADYDLRDTFLLQAQTAVAGGWTADGWYVLTPDATPPAGFTYRNGQEFLIRTNTTVPEPSTYILMASGLLLLVGFGRRRLKELGAEA
jgi:hypothetical protein